jgi:hypothetical protein
MVDTLQPVWLKEKFFIFQFSINSLKIHGPTMVDTLQPVWLKYYSKIE